MAHERTLQSTCLCIASPPTERSMTERQEDRRWFMCPPPCKEMLLTRLGLSCKQPCLFLLNIIKVIKCLKIHANFIPTWLQPNVSAVRAPWEQFKKWWRQVACWAGAWKGFLWEVSCLVLAFQLSMEWKHFKSKPCKKKKVSWPLEPLHDFKWHLWVNGWGVPGGVWDHLEV